MSGQAGGALARRKAVRVGIDCKPFYIPRCAQCRAPLADAKGNPRWDVLEERFVCLESCKRVRRG